MSLFAFPHCNKRRQNRFSQAVYNIHLSSSDDPSKADGTALEGAMKIRPFITVIIALSLLPAAAASPVESAKAEGLLQFTAGGHALGFAADGVYAAAGEHALHVTFAGANAVQPQADSPASTDGQAASLGCVVYADLWDGIALKYAAFAGGIYATAYTLAPGADPADIRLEYNAAPTLQEDGSLEIAFTTGALTESAPIAWQEVGAKRIPVEASFRVNGREVAFGLGAYDPRYALTIDPALAWNTFLGGNGSDYGQSIALDTAGNVYVAGYSNANWGNPVRTYTGGDDAFAAKLNSSGALVWNTFLGGHGSEFGYGIAVDGNRNVYVTGYTNATWGSPVRAFQGIIDAFVVKLNSTGVLAWNTFLGGAEDDRGFGIAVDGSGNVYVAGFSDAAWGSPARAYTDGDYDAFAAKLNPSGVLTLNTFLGGTGDDRAYAIAAYGSGNTCVTGYSGATWGNPVRSYIGGRDVFAAKLNASMSLSWHTFLGGNGNDDARAVAVDGSNNVYVAGSSTAAWGVPVRGFAGVLDAFAAKLTSAGALTWNTFLGGNGSDNGYGIALDGGGNVYVAGYGNATWGSPLRAYTDNYDGFAAKLISSGELASHLFLGGTGNEIVYGIALDRSGTYVAGLGDAAWGSPVRGYTADYDAIVARVNLPHTCLLAGLERYDLNGDCRTDVAVYRPSTGAWYIRDQYSANYGSPGDKPVPGDYNGDATTDIAVFRPSTGAWYIRNQYSAFYGVSTDIPVPGDYDGDGTTDLAVFRPSTGAWYIRGQASVFYGSSGDLPVPGDYDGDGSTEIAVYRPSTGAWYVRGMASVYYGVSTDIPVPGDYDGDGSTEIAVYRPSTGAWYVRGQPTNYYGVSTDIPVPGDYDGNGKTDIAVFRPSTGAWYIRGMLTVYYGASGDIPLPELSTGKAGTAP
jgi:hypothetical protein